MSKSQLDQRLVEDVVIFENKEAKKTGAQSLAPDHSPRRSYKAGPLPARTALTIGNHVDSLQQRVEQFLFHQSELLDGKHWQAYIDLFARDGVYWMPATPEQTDWLSVPSIFAEDRPMMEIRMGRVTHPNAWSQAPEWGTSHVIGNVVIESYTSEAVSVRSRFHLMELRRDSTRHFAGSYRHVLRPEGDDFRIELQRVDMVNARAPYDYVLQIWV
jgi:3-phenylpropionate/cinnamic acid dioxygenase small subunit